MKKYLLVLLILSSLAQAGIDPLVWVRGTISNKFDDKEVKVKDSQGQIYMLPRHVFPKDFKFEQGASFNLEIHENEIKDVKLLKKK